jgi:hypothetical protein
VEDIVHQIAATLPVEDAAVKKAARERLASGPIPLYLSQLHTQLRDPRVLRAGGRAAVIHWRQDIATPRGPSPDIRPTAEQITAWAAEAGCFRPADSSFDLPPWHYGLELIRI